MKRRSFIQKISAGTSFSMLPVIPTSNLQPAIFNPYENRPSTLEEAKSKEGYIVVRLALEGTGLSGISNLKGKIKLKKGNIVRTKDYFFESGYDEMEYTPPEYELSIHDNDFDVVVLWLDDVTPETQINLRGNHKINISLSELLATPEIKTDINNFTLTANLLFDKEIGKINPQDVGIKNPGDQFRFVIMADPQGGDPEAKTQDSPTRVKIHNAFIEESIERARELDPKPVFTAVIGDFVDSKGQMENFMQMKKFYDRLESPVLLEVGNHETAYGAKFSPGYYMGDLDNFFTIQKKMNGMNKLLYSFDLGQWHFIVWPDPLRSQFWPSRPHYFDWLERDLEQHKDKPVIFMQHIPIHPIGINPLINYAESIEVKRLVLEILSKYGNVKYAFSGHVHIPLKASVKTAVNMNGINFINLPAAGYRSRAFGEEDFYGGPTQGFAYVDIDGNNADVYYKNVTKEVYKYPETFPSFNPEKYPLWLNYKWELTPNDNVRNGSFEDGLEHWSRRYVYTEDENPSNLMETRNGKGINGSDALYLYSRKRGYDTPGQDRMPQTINRLCQVIKTTNGLYPYLYLTIKPDPEHYHAEYLSAAFIWIEGFKKSLKRLNLCYSHGIMIGNIGGRFSQINNIYPSHFDLPLKVGKWNEVVLNLAADHHQNPDHPGYNELDLDKLAINLGTWTINDGKIHGYGLYVDEVKLDWLPDGNKQQSKVNERLVDQKSNEEIYYFRNDHTAGEHKYASQEQLYPNMINK